MSDVAALLRLYNPALVIFPHDTTQTRPGALKLDRGTHTWGDYHPCPVEFFLALVYLEPQPRGFEYTLPWRRKPWTPLPVTPLDELRRAITGATPASTRTWEFDIADIPSQSEDAAWRTYARMVGQPSAAFPPTVYGRAVRVGSDLVLQYWYLYVYNDFGNKHEGDWEMAMVHLDADDHPMRMGVSAHTGGLWLNWDHVKKDNGRPLVYVGRGSHAGYFDYLHGGYDATVTDLTRGLNLPMGGVVIKPLIRLLARIQSRRLIQHLPFVKIWRDHVPAWTDERRAPARDRVDAPLVPDLRVMPEHPAAADDASWWMLFDGTWGSCHARFNGRTGPDSPWKQRPRWDEPLAWLGTCREYTKR
jgi:hypothetical protein